jgi:hypothetical protein
MIRLSAGQQQYEIKLLGEIMTRRLCLIHPATNDELKKLNFGSCFYGCDLTALAILYNDSPESVAYSALIDDSKATVRLLHCTHPLTVRQDIDDCRAGCRPICLATD